MKLTTVLFDLDGTLLPMDQERFVRSYVGALIRKFAPLGYEQEKMQRALMTGIRAMVENDGRMTNEQVFWETFCRFFPDALADKMHFDAFYRNEFQGIQSSCGFDGCAARLISRLQGMGLRMVLATNPLFPAAATHSRVRWAGLEPESFEWITTYENASFCKPNLAYYKQILERVNVPAQECLMVGNDVGEDMIARELGMQVFLLTDCLINRHDVNIGRYPHGGYDDLNDYIVNIMTK